MSKEKAMISRPGETESDFVEEMEQAKEALRLAEAALSEKQATINAFRMHCRLKLDTVVDCYQALRTQQQALLTEYELLRQVDGQYFSLDGFDPFEEDTSQQWLPDEEEILLPTDTPRDKAAEKRLYRQLARRFHPDLGRTALEISYRTEMMAAINQAYARSDVRALYDLAGELDPEEIAQLEVIQDVRRRRRHRQILKMQQLRRRAEQRLRLLMQENTARLWLRAQQLEDVGKDWWQPVKDEIEAINRRRQVEIGRLRQQISELASELGSANQAAGDASMEQEVNPERSEAPTSG